MGNRRKVPVTLEAYPLCPMVRAELSPGFIPMGRGYGHVVAWRNGMDTLDEGEGFLDGPEGKVAIKPGQAQTTWYQPAGQ